MLGATDISCQYFKWRGRRDRCPREVPYRLIFDLSDKSSGADGNCLESSAYRMAPGSTVTSAAEIAVAAVNERESTILTLPPFSWVACICERGNANELGITPAGLSGNDELPSAGGASKKEKRSVSKPQYLRRRRTARENVELLRGNVRESGWITRYSCQRPSKITDWIDIRLEVLCEDFPGFVSFETLSLWNIPPTVYGNVRQPIRQLKSDQSQVAKRCTRAFTKKVSSSLKAPSSNTLGHLIR